MNGLVTVLRAADAAARWHVNQRIADATIAIVFVAIGQSDHRTERLCIKA
jgi:hypothetical protein